LTSTFFAVSVFGADFGADFFFIFLFGFFTFLHGFTRSGSCCFFFFFLYFLCVLFFLPFLDKFVIFFNLFFGFQPFFFFFGFVLFFSSKSLFSNQTLNFWSFTSVFAFGVGPSSFDDSLF